MQLALPVFGQNAVVHRGLISHNELALVGFVAGMRQLSDTVKALTDASRYETHVSVNET
jgi:hypothetical protein